MFTGLIEEIGTVHQFAPTSGKLLILAKTVLGDMHTGDSIAVNGACLTVTDFDGGSFTADVIPETLRRSTLGRLHSGDSVNLERSMAANGRFGGHLVAGHVDGIGWITRRTEEGNAVLIEIGAPSKLLDLIVEKGSVAVDGVSLTIATVDKKKFGISIIPHTGDQTALVQKKAGNPVNLETDLIGKYVQKLMHIDSHCSNITLDFLQKNGF